MIIGISPTENTTGMDRQLFDVIDDEVGRKRITALNPVARDALIVCHQHSTFQ